jgi:hypothetical protein
MSTGPIEFIGESKRQSTGATELSGASGLIQPPPHTVTPREANSAMMRAAMYGDDGIDPVTGMTVPDEMNAASESWVGPALRRGDRPWVGP